ncbi:Phenylpyruvate tautomerase PptA, 4-oxalocrotonate tautomerase family [Dyadobacter sp. SG02]|uniref:tautomerase family protein n=1 Tax=Dyadobacter sp. SG02 TaxID=1855291 RepID=UPI0008BCCE40|nr:tautomerase family protein [Dyadobacter sp. SG02]SEJ37507.1 Phenylpyruvate tautomerase PptA, 4-oxalocrotonate tautomerase family [Dyadobacter sp. SG02]
MSQIKIYGLRHHLAPIRQAMSETLHACIVEAFHYPQNKRFHRFIYLDEGDFFYPEDRSDRYTIIEIALFEGRSVEVKKHLYHLIFQRFEQMLGIGPNDVEITLTETPPHNWGIRGMPGDELTLNYKISI